MGTAGTVPNVPGASDFKNVPKMAEIPKNVPEIYRIQPSQERKKQKFSKSGVYLYESL